MINFSTTQKNSFLTTLNDDLDGGKVDLFSAANVKLASIALPDKEENSIALGSLVFGPISSGVSSAYGQASYGKLTKADGSEVATISVGLSNSDLILNNLLVSPGKAVSITSMILFYGAAGSDIDLAAITTLYVGQTQTSRDTTAKNTLKTGMDTMHGTSLATDNDPDHVASATTGIILGAEAALLNGAVTQDELDAVYPDGAVIKIANGKVVIAGKQDWDTYFGVMHFLEMSGAMFLRGLSPYYPVATNHVHSALAENFQPSMKQRCMDTNDDYYWGNFKEFTDCANAAEFVRITLRDSYSEANQDGLVSLYGGAITGVGQSFEGIGKCNGENLLTKFYAKKVGLPTGYLVVKIYSHSGTFGVSSVPNTQLVASGNFNVATLTTSLALNSMTIYGSEGDANHQLKDDGTNYVVTFEYSGGDVDNYIQLGYNGSAGGSGHAGNYCEYSGSWAANSGRDLCFYLYIGSDLWLDHSAGGLIPKFPYAITHPEWLNGQNPSFYLYQVDDFRRSLCLSNQDMIDKSIENALGWMDKEALTGNNKRWYYLTYGDTGSVCNCASCLALDPNPPGGPFYITGSHGEQVQQIADRLLHWANPIAEAMLDKDPDCLVQTFAYYTSVIPPYQAVPAQGLYVTLATGMAWYVMWHHQRTLGNLDGTFSRLDAWLVLTSLMNIGVYQGPYYHPSIIAYLDGWIDEMHLKNVGIGFIYSYTSSVNFNSAFQYAMMQKWKDRNIRARDAVRNYVNYHFGAAASYVMDILDLSYERYWQSYGNLELVTGADYTQLPAGYYTSASGLLHVSSMTALFDSAIASVSGALATELASEKTKFLTNVSDHPG